MSLTIESIELNKFYSSWMQDIAATQQADDEGANSEQIFTQYAIDLLAEAGEVENARLAYDEKALGTAKQHKINAYAISENYETVDLFISIFKGNEEINKTNNEEVETASKRISNFFRKAIYSNEYEKSKVFKNEYVDEIEETSEIFQFANTLAKEQELRDNLVRVNATILTNGLHNGDFPQNIEISGYKIYFKVFDLEALFNVSEKSHIPIEIQFKQDGFTVPCIAAPNINSEYQSYLAIVPGEALAAIYERFGARLLEQNVRSYLQVGGKKSTNYGIRKTIIDCPEMFLAYNNGLTTTADEIIFEKCDASFNIVSVKDFQIVNGGQTTASIYHTLIKDKVDISKVFVQMKISLIKNKDNFSDIVSNISAFANTQNKVSIADLSSNKPYHIEFEKLSRSIFTPISDSRNIQTKWFYERARGQYKNARLKDSLPKSRLKAFDLKTPKHQVFTKEELAKYINAYEEITEGKKVLIAPHFVVKGNQKNYIQFINHNLEKKLNNIYFEDSIAKGILFKAAEKVYGVKPNAIGDMRYIAVPYAIGILTNITSNQIDLYKIWRNQEISKELKELLFEMMSLIEKFIRSIAPGGLYGEFAKKEECWLQIKSHKFNFNISNIKQDFIDKKSLLKRQIITDEEANQTRLHEEYEKLKSIPYSIWKKIEEFGDDTKLLTDYQCNIISNIANRVRTNNRILENEKTVGLKILDIIIEKAPELLFDIDDIVEEDAAQKIKLPEITIELINKMVIWDKNNKRLKDYQYKLLEDILAGKQQLTEQNKKFCSINHQSLCKYGFKY